MRCPRQWTLPAVFLCAIAVLPGCSTASPVTGPAASASAAANRRAADAFTVTGVHPVAPSGGQDTHAATPGEECDSARFTADENTGREVAAGFAATGFPVAADLLNHFLAGNGTEVVYRSGSTISKQALASSAFRAVDDQVQEAVLSQLKAGRTQVRLSAAQLPTVAFESRSSDLYWGFRGTQGLAVTGNGRHQYGRYAGTLTFYIRDSYGFPASDTLDGFGPPMRYLQTVCGAPQHKGGARWFPDTIVVTVPFDRPA